MGFGLALGFIGPNPLQGHATTIRQRLKGIQVALGVGVESVALEGDNPRDLPGPQPNRDPHDRPGKARCVPKRKRLRIKGQGGGFAQNQLRPLPYYPAINRAGAGSENRGGDILALAIDRVHKEHPLNFVSFREIQREREGIPGEQSVGNGRERARHFQRARCRNQALS